MAAEADYGFVIWNGKSLGSHRHAIDLLNRGKWVVLSLAPSKEFIALKGPSDLGKLFGKLSEPVYGNILEENPFRRDPATVWTECVGFLDATPHNRPITTCSQD